MTMPDILDGYTPQMEGLAEFVVDLMASVDDWADEKHCLQMISRSIARFYSLKRRYCDGDDMSRMQSKENRTPWKQVVESVLCPAFKARLLPPKQFAKEGRIATLADLHELYKVFERC